MKKLELESIPRARLNYKDLLFAPSDNRLARTLPAVPPYRRYR
jgi:hypothetical protein